MVAGRLLRKLQKGGRLIVQRGKLCPIIGHFAGTDVSYQPILHIPDWVTYAFPLILIT
jgi:hypothetical protein